MVKRFIIILMLLSGFTLLHAEETTPAEVPEGDSTTEQETKNLEHLDVILPPVISAVLAGIFMMEDALFYLVEWDDFEVWMKRGTIFSIHLPLYAVSPLQGVIATGVSGGLFASYELLRDQDADFFRNFFYTGIFQTGLYSTYLGYSGNRAKARPGIYNDDWRHETFAAQFSDDLGAFGGYYTEWKSYTLIDLITSPFKPRNFLDPLVGIFSVAGLISPLVKQSHDSAPWTTGKMYAGTWEMSPLAAIPMMLGFFFLESSIVSISEESHFRGFIYEELASNYGHIPAKIVDCVYFPAIHIPQEVFIAEFEPLTIGLNFLNRAILTFYMDNLYDRGGLERTVAAHFWIDFTLLFMQWLMASGEPQEDISAILAYLPELEIRIPLYY
ncbi:MAG: CPBP family intramembrane metalloprotease [Spirochaetales bacterium]|nr:CPBP family intramembrane metalloprotease [Spirochaetales bacterium]